jgi:hypothetical protein
MHLLPPSPKPFGASGELDLRIAQELERQILETQIWDKVRPVVQRITARFVGKTLNEALILKAQRLLEEELRFLGPGFPIPGIRLVLKKHPEDPFSLVLELEDE